jgi:TolB-like protein/Flp pilus assembly protein TadD
MIGKTLGHYEILEKIGAGGMGEVYRARDTKLGREVALKVLLAEKAGDPDRRKRFLREATAVAALKHPNIVTIYSVEEDGDSVFLTMELVEGVALNERIPPHGMNLAGLLDVGIPLAEAIAYAHSKGITHRDLKPANVMLDEAGRPKVLDFGLAKLLEPENTPDGVTMADDISATAPGMVLGTAAYMSPEQAEGKPADARSDVFSLGIVLYEMATGKKPFEGDTSISVISSILKDSPVPVSEVNHSLPNHLGRVVSRCLAKDPNRRYQMALEIKNELEGLREESSFGPTPVEALRPAGGGTPKSRTPLFVAGAVVVALAAVLGIWRPWQASVEQDTPSAAAPGVAASAREGREMAVVLPFENLGPPEDAYFAAGMTEEITGRLVSVRGIGVISGTSATQYDRTGKTMKQIGEDLGVDYVLEGSVRWAKNADGGGRVRISPRLIKVEGDQQIWTETYDREIDDIFDVQSEIAERVVAELGITLSGSESELLAQRPTQNREAYRLYLEALDLKTNTFEEFDTGFVDLLQRATSLDPEFLEAWYRLSLHHSSIYFQIDRSQDRLDRAKEALERAEALDASHPLTRLARGAYLYYGHRDYDRALTEFTATMEAQPNDARAQRWVSYILRRQGKLQESIDVLEGAVKLDPQNTEGLNNLAASYRARRDFDKALALRERSLEIDPGDDEQRGKLAFDLFAMTGDLERARSALGEEPGNSPLFHGLQWAFLHRVAGESESALEVLAGLEVRNPVIRSYLDAFEAMLQAEVEGVDAAREALELSARRLEAILESTPTNTDARGMLSTLHALLGNTEEALREARMAVELTALDKFSGPESLENQARVFALVGQEKEAVETLDRLMGMAYEESITPPLLRNAPEWEPLRDRADFQELLRKHETMVP